MLTVYMLQMGYITLEMILLCISLACSIISKVKWTCSKSDHYLGHPSLQLFIKKHTVLEADSALGREPAVWVPLDRAGPVMETSCV